MSKETHANHFNALRLAAALAVFVAHAQYLYRLVLPVPFPENSLGSLAVFVFFFISGYLIVQSWLRASVWRLFWIKRLARIFPALVIATVFSVFGVGSAMTTWPLSAYLTDPATWINLVNNSFALATVQTLPGVFEANPFPRTVNGSVWTIRYELLMYLTLALTGISGLLRRRWISLVIMAIWASLWLYARSSVGGEAWFVPFFGLFSVADMAGFGTLFWLGSSFAVYRARPSAAWWIAAVCGAALALSPVPSWAVQIGVATLVAAGTFAIAFAGKVRFPWLQHHDISYGVYIYAFPVQQAVTEIALQRGWPLLLCATVSLGLVLCAAVLSWLFVERPAIRWAQQRCRQKSRVVPDNSGVAERHYPFNP